MTVTLDLPAWPLRFLAYLNERFRPGLMLFMTALLVLAHGLAAHVNAGVKLNGQSWQTLVLVTVVLFLIFFHLRVFDEHKDWHIDRYAFPERVLSRGWVTLRQLTWLGAGAITLELALAWWIGWPFFLAIVGCLLYTIAMFFEFGIGTWLRRSIVLYGITHMLVLPGMILAVYLSVGQLSPQYDAFAWPLLAYAAVQFGMAFSLEVARKVRLPANEKPNVDTYSGQLGLRGALATILGCQAVALLLLTFVQDALQLGMRAVVAGLVAWLLVAIGYAALAKWLPARFERQVEALAVLTPFVLDIAVFVSWGLFA